MSPREIRRTIANYMLVHNDRKAKHFSSPHELAHAATGRALASLLLSLASTGLTGRIHRREGRFVDRVVVRGI
jgi:hypothetical protein